MFVKWREKNPGQFCAVRVSQFNMDAHLSVFGAKKVDKWTDVLNTRQTDRNVLAHQYNSSAKFSIVFLVSLVAQLHYHHFDQIGVSLVKRIDGRELNHMSAQQSPITSNLHMPIYRRMLICRWSLNGNEWFFFSEWEKKLAMKSICIFSQRQRQQQTHSSECSRTHKR